MSHSTIQFLFKLNCNNHMCTVLNIIFRSMETNDQCTHLQNVCSKYVILLAPTAPVCQTKFSGEGAVGQRFPEILVGRVGYG